MGTARALSIDLTELVELVVDLHADLLTSDAGAGCCGWCWRLVAADWPGAAGPAVRHAGAPVGSQGRDERRQHRRRHQTLDVAAEGDDLLDQARGEEGVERVGGHEEGVDPGQPMVHLGHLQLVVEVADGAQPLDDRPGPLAPGSSRRADRRRSRS